MYWTRDDQRDWRSTEEQTNGFRQYFGQIGERRDLERKYDAGVGYRRNEPEVKNLAMLKRASLGSQGMRVESYVRGGTSPTSSSKFSYKEYNCVVPQIHHYQTESRNSTCKYVKCDSVKQIPSNGNEFISSYNSIREFCHSPLRLSKTKSDNIHEQKESIINSEEQDKVKALEREIQSISAKLEEKENRITEISAKCQIYKEKLVVESNTIKELRTENIELHKKIQNLTIENSSKTRQIQRLVESLQIERVSNSRSEDIEQIPELEGIPEIDVSVISPVQQENSIIGTLDLIRNIEERVGPIIERGDNLFNNLRNIQQRRLLRNAALINSNPGVMDIRTYEDLLNLEAQLHVRNNGGYSSDMISKIPQFKYSELAEEAKKNCKDDVCPICCDVYKDEDNVKIIGCNHIYHQQCISEWLSINKNCPLCKKKAIIHHN